MTAETCEAHRAAAGWRCRQCNALLCPDCTGLKFTFPTEYPACTKCLGMADAITRHRREVASLTARIPGAFLWPLRGDGLLGLLASMMILALTSYVWTAYLALGLPLVTATLFGLVRATAAGKDHVEGAEFLDLFTSAVLPMLRLFLVFAPLWVTVGLYLQAVGFAGARGNVLVLFAVLGAAWFPVAFLTAATESSLLLLINPVAIVSRSLRLGRDWSVYSATCAALSALGLALGALGLVAGQLPMPFLSRLLEAGLLLYAPFVAARVAGLTLYLHGDSLGWGMPNEYLMPVLGAATPRATLPEPDPLVGQGGRSFAPIELSPEPTPAKSRMDRLELPSREAGAAGEASGATGGGEVLDASAEAPRSRPTSLDAASLPALRAPEGEGDEAPLARPDALDVGALPSLSALTLERIRGCIAKSDGGGALDLWRDATVDGLQASELAWLGRTAASKGEDALARRALEGAAEAPGTGDERARALVMLGRLLAERLGEREAARACMERVTREFGREPAAAFAVKWLAEPKAP